MIAASAAHAQCALGHQYGTTFNKSLGAKWIRSLDSVRRSVNAQKAQRERKRENDSPSPGQECLRIDKGIVEFALAVLGARLAPWLEVRPRSLLFLRTLIAFCAGDKPLVFKMFAAARSPGATKGETKLPKFSPQGPVTGTNTMRGLGGA